MRLEEILTDRAKSMPGRIALVAGPVKLTYAELDAMSDRLASAFVGRGIGRNDRICIFMEDWCEAVLALFATLKAGAVAVPVHPSASAEALSFTLRDSRAQAIVTEARLAGLAARALTGIDSLKLVVLAGGGNGPSVLGCLRFEDAVAAPAGAIPTGGNDRDEALSIPPVRSAGLVPGLLITHRDFAEALPTTACAGGGDEDAIITALPLASDEGLRQLFGAVQSGIALVRAGASTLDRRPIRYLQEAPRTLRSSRVR